MFRISAFAALCLAALPASAQNQIAPAPAQPAPPPLPPEVMNGVQQAASAFGGCVQTGIQAVPAAVTPEAGATTVLRGCNAQFQALQQAVQRLIAALPAERREAAQTQLRTQMGTVPTQIANNIRQMRAASAPAATPAPAPQ